MADPRGHGMRRAYDRLLATLTIALLVTLALVVLYSVGARASGFSPIWYDEVASILLAWISFLGAALATLRNAHLNFENLLVAQPRPVRAALFVFVETVFVLTFGLICWAGWRILGVFNDEVLTSIAWVQLAYVRSIVPIGALLMLVSRLFVVHQNWLRVMAGRDAESEEIQAEIVRAQEALARAPR